jgi:hypothetical protein
MLCDQNLLNQMMHYNVDAKSYLRRARERLDENMFESLFYAAFELRCGIEQRMREYLEFQEHVSNKKKQGWRIPDLGKTIEKAFKGFDKIARVTFADSSRKNIYCILYYTPVTTELKIIAGKLGDYLHSRLIYKNFDDPWWHEFREQLEAAYKELKFSCFGNLKGVPLLHPDGQVIMPMSADDSTMVLKDFGVGDTFSVKVEYLDELPEEDNSAT